MNRAILFAASLTLLPALAHADYPPSPTTLTTVDAYERQSDTAASITGIVAGESSPRTFDLWTYGDSTTTRSAAGNACEHAALVMMNRPGRFQLQLRLQTDTGNGWACKLVRQ